MGLADQGVFSLFLVACFLGSLAFRDADDLVRRIQARMGCQLRRFDISDREITATIPII